LRGPLAIDRGESADITLGGLAQESPLAANVVPWAIAWPKQGFNNHDLPPMVESTRKPSVGRAEKDVARAGNLWIRCASRGRNRL
jgi:hypothetical protein